MGRSPADQPPHLGCAAEQNRQHGAGLSKDDIRAEIEAGRWTRAGWHTVAVDPSTPQGEGRWWWAVWESGSHAVLDRATALLAAGLRHWEPAVLDVSVPNNIRPRRLPGVRMRRIRRVGDLTGAGIPRTKPSLAVVRAAQWARTDRQAATSWR